MRIIAGTHRGQRIAAPPGRDTRPTSDRVRENAFNLIGPVDDADVLDLFAGSGALGLEALSRGAGSATFVELCQDAVRAVAQERRTFDLVLLDPPYDFDAARLAPQLARLVNPDGLLVWESSGRADPPEVVGLAQRTSRKYGSARLTLFEQ
jgi:16S rRNA (guanine966-N2)-methyltransferase